MTFKRRLSLLLSCALFVGSCSISFGQDGIFADFTTSMGNFTCQLDYTNAPKAVANFVGLATGARSWLNLPTGQTKTNPFFDGLKFHRVIAGFMIQAGSPKGDGSDGPGFAFPDEFTTAVRFDRFGRLAMANSGPKSNGSQFFVTVEPTPWLNDVHTIFGQLVSGSNVVYAINQVATDTNSLPLTNVVLQSVGIRRVGTAAQNFNINTQNLPTVRNVALTLSNTPTQVALYYTNRQFCDNRLYSTTNLTDWSSENLGIEVATSGTNRVFRAKSGNQKYYEFSQIQYASSTFAPKNVLQRVITMNFSIGWVLTMNFNASGGGTYTLPPSGGTITPGYTYTQQPYRAFLWPIYFSGNFALTVRLDFTSNTGGNFSGTYYDPSGGYGVQGTFTLQ